MNKMLYFFIDLNFRWRICMFIFSSISHAIDIVDSLVENVFSPNLIMYFFNTEQLKVYVAYVIFYHLVGTHRQISAGDRYFF